MPFIRAGYTAPARTIYRRERERRQWQKSQWLEFDFHQGFPKLTRFISDNKLSFFSYRYLKQSLLPHLPQQYLKHLFFFLTANSWKESFILSLYDPYLYSVGPIPNRHLPSDYTQIILYKITTDLHFEMSNDHLVLAFLGLLETLEIINFSLFLRRCSSLGLQDGPSY